MNIRIDEYARSWLCSCAHFQPFVFIQETFNGFHIRFLWSHPPPPPNLMQPPPPFLLIHSSRLIIPKIIRIYNYLCRIISSYLLILFLILSPSYIIYFHLLNLNLNIVVLYHYFSSQFFLNTQKLWVTQVLRYLSRFPIWNLRIYNLLTFTYLQLLQAHFIYIY